MSLNERVHSWKPSEGEQIVQPTSWRHSTHALLPGNQGVRFRPRGDSYANEVADLRQKNTSSAHGVRTSTGFISAAPIAGQTPLLKEAEKLSSRVIAATSGTSKSSGF